MEPIAPESRFWDKVEKGDGCWEWKAAKTSEGYGRFGTVRPKTVYAHRFAFELANGPIPLGTVLDHLCRNRGCVRPDHLEVVSRGENVMRGQTIPAAHRRKTHCPRGHEYDAANTLVRRDGSRECRTCRKAARRRGR